MLDIAKNMAIKAIQKQAAPYLLKNCPSALQAPLAQLLSDDLALSSIMSYIYDIATGKTSFSLEALQQLPMNSTSRKTLSTPGLIKHIFTAIQPLLSSLPGKISLSVPEEVKFSPMDTDDDTTPEIDYGTRSGDTNKSARSRSFDTELIDTNFSDDYTYASNSGGKIRLLPALFAGGLSLSGVLSTVYTLYYSICYDPTIACSVSSILGYVALIAGLFMGYRWILKPRRSGTSSNQRAEGEFLPIIVSIIFAGVMCAIMAAVLYYGAGIELVIALVYSFIFFCGGVVIMLRDDDEAFLEIIGVGLLIAGAILSFLQLFYEEWISHKDCTLVAIMGIVFYLMHWIFKWLADRSLKCD